MKTFAAAAGLVLAALAPPGLADGLNPGSVLIYPAHVSDVSFGGFTIISVTNVNKQPTSGSTNAHFEYLNVITNSNGETTGCAINNRTEHLTPADTLSVLTNCHNPVSLQSGYLVVSAADPSLFSIPWSHNYLVGSEILIDTLGVVVNLNAIPFSTDIAFHQPTDDDEDEKLDFDGVEYEGIADTLVLDSFVAGVGEGLTLINMSGGTEFTAFVAFDIFNDDEFPLSGGAFFRCWTQERLEDINGNLSLEFLANNVPGDPEELDTNCDKKQDMETGWMEIRGVTAFSDVMSISAPAILGANSGSFFSGIGGRRLWETDENPKRLTGEFLNFGGIAEIP